MLPFFYNLSITKHNTLLAFSGRVKVNLMRIVGFLIAAVLLLAACEDAGRPRMKFVLN
ncbi:MAG: hypothetical protein HC915_09455 [Anaerolineae bacterium]|nr:hypothetical protein [Anaerolineae bacterium]